MEVKTRTYECTQCGHREDIKTNHTGECYPVCTGKCRSYYRTGHGAAEQEHVGRVQTPHKYIKDV